MFSRLFCKHNFVEGNGFVYCTKCGKQRMMECVHIWNNIDRLERTYNLSQYDHDDVYLGVKTCSAIVIVQQCSKCGEVRPAAF